MKSNASIRAFQISGYKMNHTLRASNVALGYVSTIMELFMWKFATIYNSINGWNSRCFRNGKCVFVFLWSESFYAVCVCAEMSYVHIYEFYVNVHCNLMLNIKSSTVQSDTIQFNSKWTKSIESFDVRVTVNG